MTRIALAVSPHLDDAVFSAGATLAGLARDGWRVLVATVFTGNVERPTGFALECQTSKGITAKEDYMALRRDEDRAACRAIGAKPIHLPLLEAPHRGYESPAALFAPPRADDDAWASARHAVEEFVATNGPQLILAPRGVGGHVDHLIVHRAVRASAGDAALWWWRDWPYDDRPDAPDPLGLELAGWSSREGPHDDRSREAKRRACHAYQSQLGFQFGGPAALDARLATMGPESFAVGQLGRAPDARSRLDKAASAAR